MSKDENKFNFEIEEKGKSVDRAFSITEVTLQQQNEARRFITGHLEMLWNLVLCCVIN